MKAITKRFLAVFLSLFLIIAPTIQQANAASSWSITGAVSAGSRTVVSASKAGFKSAVNIAPTAGRLALKLRKGANWASLLYAAIQLAPDLADINSFQPQYAENRVRYSVPAASVPSWSPYHLINDKYTTAELACRAYVAWYKSMNYTSASYVSNTDTTCTINRGDTGAGAGNSGTTVQQLVKGQIVKPAYIDYIPIPVAAAQVIRNANAGHAASQAATRETATEMVIGGQFDQDLLAGAVPTSDNKPLVPSVPISGNGNVTHGSDIGIGDDGMSGATPGQQADAAKDAADASKKAAEAAADAAKAAAEDARKAADDAQDLINSGADTDAIDAANDRAKAAEQAAVDAKAAADAAVAAANDRAAAAERAAAAATAAAQAAAAQAAADAAAAQAAADAAAAADKAAAQAAADAAAAAAAQAARDLAAAKEKQAAAEKAAEKAKAEAAKPFELPAFCTWAAIVCETAKWLKEEPASMTPTTVDTDSPIDDFDSDKSYITFTGSCPPKYTASLSIMGATAPFEFDYTPICTVMSYLKPFIVGAGYIAAAYIIAGHSRGSKD